MLKKGFLVATVLLLFLGVGGAKVIEGIVAKVNDGIITLSELEAAKQAVSHSTKIPIEQIPEEAVKEILNRLIEAELVLQEAKQRGIEVSPLEIDKVLDEIKSRFKSEEEFKEALDAQGYTIEDLRKDYREELLRSKLVEQEIKSKIQITPQELEEIKGHFAIQLHAKHILVKTQEEAEMVLQRLKKGTSFEGLAKKNSLCPSKEKGGDLGFFARGEMVKEFDKAAFALNDGEISGVVKTQFGYHIIKAIEQRSTPKKDLTRLAQEASYLLWQEKFNKRLREWVKELYDKAYVEVMP